MESTDDGNSDGYERKNILSVPKLSDGEDEDELDEENERRRERRPDGEGGRLARGDEGDEGKDVGEEGEDGEPNRHKARAKVRRESVVGHERTRDAGDCEDGAGEVDICRTLGISW